METQTTITIDPTNSLAAMAFVVADQQRVIKQLQEENACFLKEYKEALDIDKQQYIDLDAQHQNLQKQYDDACADFNREKEDLLSKLKELTEAHNNVIFTLTQTIKDLRTRCEGLRRQLNIIPVCSSCRIEQDERGNNHIVGFEKDGPVLLFFHVSGNFSGFWDCFCQARKVGEIACACDFVKGGKCGENIIYSIDPDKDIKYLPVADFVSYIDDPDCQQPQGSER